MERVRQESLEKQKRFLFPAIATYHSEPLVRGKGLRLCDTEGRRYPDFFGGILTISAGHCNDRITDALVEQARTLQHASTLFLTAPHEDTNRGNFWEHLRESL